MLPRVAWEYGHTRCASLMSSAAVCRSPTEGSATSSVTASLKPLWPGRIQARDYDTVRPAANEAEARA